MTLFASVGLFMVSALLLTSREMVSRFFFLWFSGFFAGLVALGSGFEFLAVSFWILSAGIAFMAIPFAQRMGGSPAEPRALSKSAPLFLYGTVCFFVVDLFSRAVGLGKSFEFAKDVEWIALAQVTDTMSEQHFLSIELLGFGICLTMIAAASITRSVRGGIK